MSLYFHLLRNDFVTNEYPESFHSGRIRLSHYENTLFLGVL